MRKRTTEELLESLAMLVIDNGEKMKEGFAAVDKRFDKHDNLFISLNKRVDLIEDDIKDIKRSLGGVVGLVAEHEKRIGKIEYDLNLA